MSYTIKQGDLLPPVTATLLDTSGNPFDATNAIGVQFVFRNKNSSQEFTRTGRFADKATGKVAYDWNATETDVPGIYDCEFKLLYSGGRLMSFPSANFFNITIVADL